MTSQSPCSHGHPIAATAVVGSFAFALILVMRVAGLIVSADQGLASVYMTQGFGVEAAASQPVWALPLAAVLVYAVVWLLFETPGAGRRVMMLLTALVLIVALSPVLALWGVFWSPVLAGTGVAWGGFCAILWTRQHRMPCELPVPEEVRGDKIIPMKKSETKEVKKVAPKKTVKRGGKRRQRQK